MIRAHVMIAALLEVLGPRGTLVMPAESPHVRSGKIGEADALLFSTRALVDFAEGYFREALTCP